MHLGWRIAHHVQRQIAGGTTPTAAGIRSTGSTDAWAAVMQFSASRRHSIALIMMSSSKHLRGPTGRGSNLHSHLVAALDCSSVTDKAATEWLVAKTTGASFARQQTSGCIPSDHQRNPAAAEQF
jgi:hypothetical protein